jgi:hypothetical protein
MALDPTWLFLSLIPSGVGIVLLVYGKKFSRWPSIVGGLALMAYPYFAPSIAALVGVGAIIGVGLWYASRRW